MTPYYQDDAVTIYHGDCREILPGLEPVDLVLTDPPYGIETWNDRSQSDGTRFSANNFRWDNRPSLWTITAMLAKADCAIIFGFNHLADLLGPTKGVLIWDKKLRGLHFNDCELAWCHGLGEACRIFEYEPAKAERKEHPTEKPLALLLWCLEKHAPSAETILDPFMGSGTTLRAAKDLGRKAIGIEIEEKYCEIAAKRMSQEVLQFTA